MARTFTVNEVSRMLIQSLKVLSKTIIGLSMFSEIGKLRVRKKVCLLEPRSMFKDYDVHRVQALEKWL